jgi:mersacidin/lichenicidin family type 2 lantibiotic
MDTTTIIRAWKDPTFRSSLSPEERAALPKCPAGSNFTELDESDLGSAVGGGLPVTLNRACLLVRIEPIRFPICYASHDPVTQDPLTPVINPALDKAQRQFAL